MIGLIALHEILIDVYLSQGIHNGTANLFVGLFLISVQNPLGKTGKEFDIITEK
jgi:hypothetical protein